VKLRSNPKVRRPASAQGFTLVELLVSLLILTVVAGAVFEQINQMQKKSSSEAIKLDMNQAAREFVDQTVRDLHMSGYPGPSMYTNPQGNSAMVAVGLVSVSPTQIIFEGDVNNDGNVDNVNIQYVANDPADPNCPCIRRSVQNKSQVTDPLNPGIALPYTETTNVFAPGTGAGQAGEDLFAYYDRNGNVVDFSTGSDISTDNGKKNLSAVKTIKINLSLLTTLRDPASNGQVRNSMSATARLNQ
jgi:prepilin-type N-terminal cleavage/methylation domain-containing protein